MSPSRVWNYFTRSADKSKATCNLCNQDFVFKNTTSNLLNHLNGKHPSVLTSETVKQTTMNLFVNSPKKSKADNETITQTIADMIVSDYLPLSLVEGVGFRKLMTLVAPDYKVPCRKTIRSRVEKRYDEEREALSSELKGVSSASLTTDTWTSNSTESYITVTEHHLTDEWNLETNVLLTRSMPERHTGENLAARLKDAVDEFQLSGKIDTCVHDNARNMDSAGRLCEEWGDLGCFGHTLQLVLKPALELPAVIKLTNRCRKLVGHFKHSTTLTGILAERQRAMGIPEHTLIQDVATRWNSAYEMMARLLEQRRVLSDILLDPGVTKKNDSSLNLHESEWDLISELCSVLQPFQSTTSYMSTESFVSVSEIYPIVCGLLKKRLVSSSSDSSTISRVKDAIRDEVLQRYNPTTDDTARSTAALGALLDTRYKKLPFFTSKQRKLTSSVLESRIDDLPLRLPTSEHQQSTYETPSKRQKLDFIEFCSPDTSVEDELQVYLCEKATDTDPLTWWRDNESRFPKIAVVAKSVLSVPATSVPSERIFSATGLLLNKLRNRLSSDIVDKIIFLNKNGFCN